jgi:hypothetical protein
LWIRDNIHDFNLVIPQLLLELPVFENQNLSILVACENDETGLFAICSEGWVFGVDFKRVAAVERGRSVHRQVDLFFPQLSFRMSETFKVRRHTHYETPIPLVFFEFPQIRIYLE